MLKRSVSERKRGLKVASKFDAECLEAEVLSIVQANLPAKLIAIDAEKADGLTTPSVENADYYTSDAAQNINASPYIKFGTISIDADDQSVIGTTARSYSVILEVVFIEDFSGDDTRKFAFRYIRALREIIDGNFRSIKPCSGLDILEVLPQDFRNNDDQSVTYKIGGIVITTTIVG